MKALLPSRAMSLLKMRCVPSKGLTPCWHRPTRVRQLIPWPWFENNWLAAVPRVRSNRREHRLSEARCNFSLFCIIRIPFLLHRFCQSKGKGQSQEQGHGCPFVRRLLGSEDLTRESPSTSSWPQFLTVLSISSNTP